LKIDKNFKILIYQGVVLHGRGLKYLIEAISKLDHFVLIILGDGEHLNYYKTKVNDHDLKDKVFFLGKIENKELYKYTAGAYIGAALIENISLSYFYALPNKLFEYIMCGIPSIVSKLPQMEQITEKYHVGKVVDLSNTENIISTLSEMEEGNVYYEMVENCKRASKELNWENEVLTLLKIIKSWE
jgi:glycosyltransferase involved in cell wall biosynthesis